MIAVTVIVSIVLWLWMSAVIGYPRVKQIGGIAFFFMELVLSPLFATLSLFAHPPRWEIPERDEWRSAPTVRQAGAQGACRGLLILKTNILTKRRLTGHTFPADLRRAA
jgi:hypothetical protein